MANKRLKISYLCHSRYHQTKMSRGPRFHYAKAVGEHEDVDLLCTGPGHVGYHDDWSVERNLKALGFNPDVIWVYKPEDMIGVAECKVPKVVSMNECYWDGQRADKETRQHGIDLVVLHHQNDAQRFGTGVRTVHIPHAADPKLFASRVGLGDRANRATLFGVLSEEHYPLRCQMAKAINEGLIPNAGIRKHPGYKLQGVAACETQFRQYAADVRNTAVFLTCSSKWHYFLEKIVQAAMAGCVIVTDEPDDDVFRKWLAPYCLIVPHEAQAAEIADILWERCQFIWNNDVGTRAAWNGIAFALQSIAIKELSTDRYAQRFVDAVCTLL
jgi:hypothetical protein